MIGVCVFIALGVAGVALRQVDRLHFRIPGRHQGAGSVPEILARQRERANDLTPALLLLGHWMEIAAWWGPAARLGPAEPAGLVLVAVMTAIKFRHLQEVSHFAAHGVLFRRLPIGDAITEFSVHAPLGFRPVAARRERHVRRHHPNAAVPDVDPNLDELLAAGLGPGTSEAGFVRAVLFPLTPRGIATTMRDMIANLGRDGWRGSWWWRAPIAVLMPFAAFALGGLPVLIAGYVVPRLLLYPQLSWMSLLVEHTWFEPAASDAGRKETEADRCVRVYRNRRALETFARCTWLPYGDLYHYAHSVHPAARWNYLPRLEALLGFPERTAPRVFFGRDSVLGKLRAATRPDFDKDEGQPQPAVSSIRYALRPLPAPAGSPRSAPRRP
ncbi:MAG TPA: fatty acid desaturase [Actinocrinis sp.]|nr:fatty acid desaturase [Actinocrinis sp.]